MPECPSVLAARAQRKRVFRIEPAGAQAGRAQKETVGLATGTCGQLSGRDASGGVLTTLPEKNLPTLAAAGIDKNLVKRARSVL
jgi:hypothetical protein